MKGIRALVSAALAALTLVALALPATAAPGDLRQYIAMQGNAVYLLTNYTPEAKFNNWDRMSVDYRVLYIKAGTNQAVVARQGEINVRNDDAYKKGDGTYQELTNAFIILGPGDKIVVELTYRHLLDKNDKSLFIYKDTELQYTHPGAPMPTTQLGTATACLDDCLAQLSQEPQAGGDLDSPQVVATG